MKERAIIPWMKITTNTLTCALVKIVFISSFGQPQRVLILATQESVGVGPN